MKPVLRTRPRTILLREGELCIVRRVHECPSCRCSLAALDRELGVAPHERLSRSVLELVSYKAARMSFADVSEDLAHCHSINVSVSEVHRTAHKQGARIAELLEGRDERWNEPVSSERPVHPPEIDCEVVAFETDGVVVLTRPGEEHKTVWLARAFGIEHRGKDQGQRPFLTQSRFAAGAATLEEFRHNSRALANRMGARSATTTIALADGAPPLWRLIEEVLPGAVQIQDYWHVAQHLCGLSKQLHGEDAAAFTPDAERWKTMLWDGRVEELITELQGLAPSHQEPKRQHLEREIAYLEAGRHRMDYPRYRREHWPVGSGAIEGTCKHLAKQRFGITGARWKRATINNILALRLAQFNHEWQRYWQHEAA